MKMLSKKEVCDRVGISRAEIHRRLEKGTFPIPVKDGPYHNSRVFWLEHEIDDYIRKLFARRHSAPLK